MEKLITDKVTLKQKELEINNCIFEKYNIKKEDDLCILKDLKILPQYVKLRAILNNDNTWHYNGLEELKNSFIEIAYLIMSSETRVSNRNDVSKNENIIYGCNENADRVLCYADCFYDNVYYPTMMKDKEARLIKR